MAPQPQPPGRGGGRRLLALPLTLLLLLLGTTTSASAAGAVPAAFPTTPSSSSLSSWVGRCVATLPTHGVALSGEDAAALCQALQRAGGRRIVIDAGSGSGSGGAGGGASEGDEGGFATFSGAERGRDVLNLALTALCVLCAAVASGLTIGLMSIDPLELEVKARAGAPWEKAAAARILPLVTRHHLLLVSLLLLNAAAAEALPIFLDALVPSWCAILVSTTLVLVVGEIVPTSIFSGPGQLRLAGKLTPLVWFIVGVFSPIAYPIARMLDCCLGGGSDEDGGHGKRFTPAELAALLEIHQQEAEALLKLTSTAAITVPDPPQRPRGLSASSTHLLTALALAGRRPSEPPLPPPPMQGYTALPATGGEGGEGEGGGSPGRTRAASGALLTTRRLASTPGHNTLRRQLSTHQQQALLSTAAAAASSYSSTTTMTGDDEGEGERGVSEATTTVMALEEGGGRGGAIVESGSDKDMHEEEEEKEEDPPLLLPSSPAGAVDGEGSGRASLTPPPRAGTPRLPLAATPMDALRAYLPLSPGRGTQRSGGAGEGEGEGVRVSSTPPESFASRLFLSFGGSPRGSEGENKEGATATEGEGDGMEKGVMALASSLRGVGDRKAAGGGRLGRPPGGGGGLRQPLLDGEEGEEEGFDVEM